ncbi:hypothetical protein [Terribacillus saccharophilus]|uniref:hypothetical protein n=1 Tax=Terribacillus saccharophilus TaxID=361277 RepID=UPI002989D640|nr:hypothetical protein [Terribacillus saccharophilus]MCM3225938.1 hypothetical protein [Terribacillus saccharophilus]
MTVELHVVPPGGGEVDHVKKLSEGQMGFVPRKGEYVLFKEEEGTSAFEVINVHSFYEKGQINKFIISNIIVEAEPVILPEGLESEPHKKLCAYHKVIKKYPETIY